MLFKEYMRQHKKKLKDCSNELGLSIPTIQRYTIEKRRPLYNHMRKLFLWSNGAVEPNDFYPIDEWREELKEDN